MLTTILYVAGGLLVLLIGLAIFVQTRSGEFHVARSLKIDAPPEAIFPHVNNLAAWKAWSPFEKVDPNMSKSLEGPAEGVGAVYRWSGNSRAGAGSTTIVDSVPNQLVQIELKMTAPMNCLNDVRFTFEPQDGGTLVTWDMRGPIGFFGKCLHMVINCDKMCGDQFTEGLTNLKEIAESEAKAPATST
ncbi:polyketide cyclase [bacterium]|nr:polyketide cyclase [bacterium]